MAIGTGLEPRHRGRSLADALWRESQAGVLVTCKESKARAWLLLGISWPFLVRKAMQPSAQHFCLHPACSVAY